MSTIRELQPYRCEIQEQKEQPTVHIRTRTSAQRLPEAVGKAYELVFRYLGKMGAHPASPPYIAYHNMDMQDLDVEIGVAVSRELPASGEIKNGHIPGGTFATCLHIGPYTELHQAYDALTKWVQEEGYEAGTTVYEFYLNSPDEVVPDELETRICFPVKRKSQTA
jgi:effector-binding domain-containing protein